MVLDSKIMSDIFNQIIQTPKGRFALFLGIAVIVISGVAFYANFNGQYVPNGELVVESPETQAGGLPGGPTICSKGKVRACIDYIFQDDKTMMFKGHGENGDKESKWHYKWEIKYNSKARKHLLNEENSFSTDSIPEGTHTIYFRTGIKKARGIIWSQWISREFMVSVLPSITVVSPNGGEKWEIGKTYPIRLRFANLPVSTNDLFIELFASKNEVAPPLIAEGPLSENFYWIAGGNGLPFVPIPAGDYKIKVNLSRIDKSKNIKVLLASDTSDAPFSIVYFSQDPTLVVTADFNSISPYLPQGSSNIEVAKFRLVNANNINDIKIESLTIKEVYYEGKGCYFKNFRLYDGTAQISDTYPSLGIDCGIDIKLRSLTIPRLGEKVLSLRLDVPFDAKIGEMFGFGLTDIIGSPNNTQWLGLPASGPLLRIVPPLN